MSIRSKTWRADQARWIWLSGAAKPANAYAQFRKTFRLKDIPETAYVHASADCRYLLFINGKVVGHGPITTHNKYKQIDPYEVSSYLRKGENVIGALVLQRHTPNCRLYPTRGGFLLQLDTEDIKLGTDATWKARWANEYHSDTPTMTGQYGNQEWVDGRKIPVGWENAGFDDHNWINAILVRNADRYWPKELEVRAVSYPLREIIHPVELISFFGIASQAGEEDFEPAKAIMCAYNMSTAIACDAENIVHPKQGPAVFLIKVPHGGNGIGIVVDLGEEMFGYPFIDIECGSGVVVNIGHGEILSRNRIQTVLRPESQAEQRYADRYITRAGRQRFEIYDTKGCRYLEIHFTHLDASATERKVIIHEIGFARSQLPFTRVSDFKSHDQQLNKTWDICRRTAKVLCQDWLICDAQREQNQWPVLMQEMLFYQCFGKVEVVRQMIHAFCRLQMPDGYFLSYFPLMPNQKLKEITMKNMYFFTNFILPIVLYLDWLYGGEDKRQLYWLECCGRMFDKLFTLIGPNGTVRNIPGDPWMEWSGADIRWTRQVKRSSEITWVNAFAVLSLELASKVADAYDQKKYSAIWRKRAAEIRQAADCRFWSNKRSAYVDGVYDGRPSSVVSQSTNASAIVAELGNKYRRRKALSICEDPKRCDVPSHLSMMSMYHEALQSMEMDEGVVLKQIRDNWGYMLDHGATTSWEAKETLEYNDGLCLPFAHPLNYLARTVLGVTPLTPGYRRFSVRIVPYGLKHARGKIATPSGFITIAWEAKPTVFKLKLTVPQGCEAVIAPPMLRKDNKLSEVKLDGKTATLTQYEVATCTFLRKKIMSCVVGHGKHEVICSYAISVE